MASEARGQRGSSGIPPTPSAAHWRWHRVFPGLRQELSELRQWLSSLLPECPERDDVLTVATELGGNAILHTASGRPGGRFAVEVTWSESVVQVAVADCGGPAEPKVIDDPHGERGRGLLMVRGLSVGTGFTGDERGRLVWAQIAWPERHAAGDAQIGQALCRGHVVGGDDAGSVIDEAIISVFDQRVQYAARVSAAEEATCRPALSAIWRVAESVRAR